MAHPSDGARSAPHERTAAFHSHPIETRDFPRFPGSPPRGVYQCGTPPRPAARPPPGFSYCYNTHTRLNYASVWKMTSDTLTRTHQLFSG
jgi:hypothetical protein